MEPQTEFAVFEVVRGDRAVVQPLEHVPPGEKALVIDAEKLDGRSIIGLDSGFRVSMCKAVLLASWATAYSP